LASAVIRGSFFIYSVERSARKRGRRRSHPQSHRRFILAGIILALSALAASLVAQETKIQLKDLPQANGGTGSHTLARHGDER
jgi:hypothetical protein